jgi:hypothetical protein
VNCPLWYLRAASVRASEAATVLQWSAQAFRNLLVRYPCCQADIQDRCALVEKERAHRFAGPANARQ